MNRISRREFAAVVATATVAGRIADPSALGQNAAARSVTASDIVERIRKNIGVEWSPDTVDTVKAGDPSTVATGVVTTAMATLDVLRQAVKAGANVVITCEPTFYAKADARTPPAGRGGGRGAAGAAPPASAAPPPADPVFAGKNEFITRNNLVVFRLSDHWRRRKPDPLAQGLAAALGWTGYQSAGDPLRFDIPATTLDRLVDHLKQRLHVRGGLRVVGDPQTAVRRAGLLPGSTPIQAAVRMLPGVDVIVAGEVREWETVEYARDAGLADPKKGLILLSRVVSEEPGMDICATWLRTFVPEVPIRHISAGDPYWRPA
jgi:putative NIF3 family GTP cyclohydrolase 1 type 2